MVQNKAFIYKKIPNGLPIPGEDVTVEDIGFDENALPPKNGFSMKNLYASYDPGQRRQLRDPAIPSYSAALKPGRPVVSVSVIGQVLESDRPNIKKGALVTVQNCSTEEYSIVPESLAKDAQLIEPKDSIPLTAYLGVLGIKGLTAYGSLREIARPKKGETILISAAAGAVGQIVGQICVREGLRVSIRVIGSVGDDSKLEFITKELRFTSGFNYKKEKMADALKRLAPDGLDIYFDNVGDELLDTVLWDMKTFGRIVASGTISTYNSSDSNPILGVKSYSKIVRRRLKWEGFLVYDQNIQQWGKQRDEDVFRWIANGELKSVEHITEGIENAAEGFVGMLKGDLGKSILKITKS
ncbi:uncharacterized protein A1O5_09394 [Cladophialophora psammophila CBS 110553]|uniref:Enoyl reductase (ER) domain-containing protein n=1 Tax=Cladophialophora psammophila CBS 110553 TaxID=1182543 RepID=W9WRW7_9EURO|nr:uncharacterized protein A1O5_09394 [Cladophialophora psammophila CBS 110553]EXJ67381.1 hypothetical protein A1O5_09394 [Cladophialophora psammophila CBS 110553]